MLGLKYNIGLTSGQYDSGSWHISNRPDSYVVMEGVIKADFGTETHSSSTGFYVRSATIDLPVSLDVSRNHVTLATDSSSGLNVYKAILTSSNQITLMLGQVTSNASSSIQDWPISVYVAGYKASVSS